MKTALLSLFLFGWTCSGLNAQSTLYQPVDLQRAYEAGTRSLDGQPGPNYWQNRADYWLQIWVSPPSTEIRGEAVIAYVNNSPDELREFNFKLAQNTRVPTSQRAFDVSPGFLTEGFQVHKLTIGEFPIDWNSEEVNHSGDATNHRVELPRPLPPGGQTVVRMEWTYDLGTTPDDIREGVVDSTTFFLAYFFPRIAVYDDLNGWDETKLNEQTEFYNDFGSYDVTVHLPRNFVVWATGSLQNPMEVLQPAILNRLDKAADSKGVVHIVTDREIEAAQVTLQQPELSWHFQAADVTDFALGLSDHYRWDAVLARHTRSPGDVFIHTAYQPNSVDFPEAADMARKTVEYFARKMPGYPFPYPNLTVFNGHSMMEYPMMVNDVSLDNTDDVIALITHEIAHQYAPFMIGVNESRYAWMDEGWATFLEYHASYGAFPLSDSMATFPGYYQRKVKATTDASFDLPLYTPTDLLFPNGYGFNSYGKAATAYTALKELLGEEEFKRCLHEYFRRWTGKHPVAHDFFYTFNDCSGKDLDWFWKAWFFEYNRIDLAITGVELQDGGIDRIEVTNRGGKPVPIKLRLTLADGSQEVLRANPKVWRDRSVVSFYYGGDQRIVEARLLDDWYVDPVPEDNLWRAAD